MFILVWAFIIVSRILLINVNSAEWGDSYRILRASNFVREFSYPTDEKRPPLFSALLAIRPDAVDPVLWGRLFMLLVSGTSMLVFYKLCRKFLPTKNQRALALLFLFLNPVYLYWSLRIYADVPFSLLVMLCFLVLELWKEKPSTAYTGVMGLLCGLAILTRFEGYLLSLATLLGLAVISKNKVKTLLIFSLATGLAVLPWLIYRNPFTSSYFEEPVGRKYDFEMLITYVISYLFVLGVIPAGALAINYLGKVRSTVLPTVVKRYPHILAFVLLESALILIWPAAVPRLFVPVIPFLVIALVKNIDTFFVGNKVRAAGIVSVLLTLVYTIVQNKLRLQFLGPNTTVFAIVVATSAIVTLLMVLKKRRLFILSAALSMLALSVSTIYLHKDVYRSIKEISNFSLREAHGKIIHNDTASIVNWYFPKSEYKNFDNKKYLTQGYLLEEGVDFIIITNEFDPNLEIDLKKRPYLHLVTESKYVRGGKMFFTWLVKVQK